MFTNFRPSDSWEVISGESGNEKLKLKTEQGEAVISTHPPDGMDFVRSGAVWLQATTSGIEAPIKDHISLHACIEAAQYEAEEWLSRSGRMPRRSSK